MKDVISKLSQIKDSDKINMLNDGNINLEIDGAVENISKDDLIIDEVPIDGVSVSSNNGIVVGINVNISDELEKEGLVRDMIRHIQNFRKESDLEVQDRIDVCIKADSKIIEAIEENLEYFKNEILAVSITYDVLNSQYSKKIELNGMQIDLGISISSKN